MDDEFRNTEEELDEEAPEGTVDDENLEDDLDEDDDELPEGFHEEGVEEEEESL